MAGPEIAVATTKAYSAQLVASYALAVHMASVRGQITEEEYTNYTQEMLTLPEKIRRVLDEKLQAISVVSGAVEMAETAPQAMGEISDEDFDIADSFMSSLGM